MNVKIQEDTEEERKGSNETIEDEDMDEGSNQKKPTVLVGPIINNNNLS